MLLFDWAILEKTQQGGRGLKGILFWIEIFKFVTLPLEIQP